MPLMCMISVGCLASPSHHDEKTISSRLFVFDDLFLLLIV